MVNYLGMTMNNIIRFYLHLAAKCCFILTVIISLNSCSIFEAPPQIASTQPGDYLASTLKAQNVEGDDKVLAALNQIYKTAKMPKNTVKALRKHPKISSQLIQGLASGLSIEQVATKLSKQSPKAQTQIIYLSLLLYPIDSYQILESLSNNQQVKDDNLIAAALMAGLDPSRILPASASEEQAIKIEPLINSTSVTVFHQEQGNEAQVRYRVKDTDKWFDALSLQWEPIRGALSGSIVHLKADTEYQLQVTLLKNGSPFDQNQYEFKTRSNSPPINPNLVYQLSDIYHGGQLDLKLLNIHGEADGWAKIIGDPNTVITANEEDNSAINIGDQSYIMFENITVKGGRRFAIHASQAHHLWIKGCDISQYGRVANDYRDGIGYESTDSSDPINYDSGIYLERTGVVVVEDCEIHDPNGKANNWGSGHPHGPNAMLIWADHPTEEYRGQYIIRNNRFYGTPDHRFNDIIEGLRNFRRDGSFGRDSAIYNNYFAYSNDDIIELDGGQSNVLFYNNELTQGYCGISVAPNMLGPSYIFNNYIHDLGDDRGKDWTAVKMGGLITRPAGITNLFENLIIVNNNGVARSGVDGDRTFWLNAQNNIIISKIRGGRGIYDKEFYEGSIIKNNLIYNMAYGLPFVEAIIGNDFYHPWSQQSEKINKIIDAKSSFNLKIDTRFLIPNFSTVQAIQQQNIQTALAPINFNDKQVTSFPEQDISGTTDISDNGTTIVITGNSWKKIDFPYNITSNTYLALDLQVSGNPEITGIALETDNIASAKNSFNLFGSQNWGIRDYQNNQSTTFNIPVGQYLAGPISSMVLIVDNDNPQNGSVSASFSNVRLYEQSSANDEDGDNNNQTTVVGIDQ